MMPHAPLILEPEVEYPDSDGQPMADNTLQWQWMVTIKENLEDQFSSVQDVFVAGDLLWYAVKGAPTIRRAPDILLAFGRTKGRRGSYKQWEEGGIAPQVVWEIKAPGNRPDEMDEKFEFYERYGVEEYYLYDPEENELFGWRRGASGRLEPIPSMDGWVSPLMGIRFDMSGEELVLYRADGERFLSFHEVAEQRREALLEAEEHRRAREEAEREIEYERQARAQAEQRILENQRAREQAEQAATQARQQAEQTAQQMDQERRSREEAQRRADALAERLRALGIDPDQATG